MKNLFPFLVAIACAAGSLQAVAATQSQSPIPNGTSAPNAEHQSKGVRTGDWEYATPQMIPLDPQPVRSWGAAMQTGARNAHVSPPHGALVTAGDRSSVPGRE
jgi:hypothetical protein